MTTERDSLIDLNNKQIAQIKSFNEIGARHAEELTAAQEEIDNLRDRLGSGPERVYVKADCPAAMPDKPGTGSVGDATAARLTEAAQQDYLRLRQMMTENLQQTRYLQDYIKTQCLVNQ
ncbi:lysis protein [Vibrio sp. Vf1514]|uniref:lysis protein n=1 Tax=Vibrio sp. Vf1514 TaxID=3437381 RepID=UPI003F8A8BC3